MHIMFEILTTIFESLFKILFEGISLLFGISKNKGYSASFASEGSLLSRWNKGFSLTGRKQITIKQSYTNCLIQAQTGQGKTQCCIFPTIFSTQASLIIHDPSQELFKAAGYLVENGFQVKVLNFTDQSVSSGYNPMSR